MADPRRDKIAQGVSLIGLTDSMIADDSQRVQELEVALATMQDDIRNQLVAGFRVHSVGVDIADWVNEDLWEHFGKLMATVKNKWQWLIGDWLAHGNHHYGDKVYDKAAEYFGGSPDTWKDYAYIARNVEKAERSAFLSVLVHRPVAPYNDDPELQHDLIAIAEQYRLSKEIFEAVIDLYIEGQSYTHLLPGKITPVDRARLKADKHRASVLKKATGKQRDKWLSYAREQAELWSKLEIEIGSINQ